MDFDVSKVYTAVNADQLKVGSKVLVSNCISCLKEQVANYGDGDDKELVNICSESSEDGRFGTLYDICHLAYLISEPEEKQLKWTDLKIGDFIKNENSLTCMVTAIDFKNISRIHIHAGDLWLSDSELAEDWEKVER